MDYIETKANGIITPKQGKNTRIPYEHQKDAMNALTNLDNSKSSYSGLIVLPTGGGKTYTAATWLLKNLNRLEKWLKNESELYLVIDEAHHATAKTYRKIIDYLKENVPNVKTIGLTATPFRTADSDRGLLKKIFSDDIIYSISLK